MACLAIAGVLYSGVAAVITLMVRILLSRQPTIAKRPLGAPDWSSLTWSQVKYDEIDLESPLSSAFAARGLGWVPNRPYAID
jgi:hypothetical protein